MTLRQQRKRGFPPAPWTWGVFPMVEGKDYAVDPESGCWNWLGYIDPRGYGACQRVEWFAATGTNKAHRQAYMAAHEIVVPPEIDLHHKCENTRCINPEHLQPIGRSAHLRGHLQGDSNLTADDVTAMRWAAWTGLLSMTDLARRYGHSVEHIRDILDGRSWRSAPGPTGKPPCQVCGKPGAYRKTMRHRECVAGEIAA